MKKNDILIILFVVVLISILGIYLLTTNKVKSDARVLIKQDGVTLVELDYSENLNYEKTFESDSRLNVVVIEDGHIHMHDANCPDKKCILQGEISLENYFLPIICAPNNFVISIESNENEIDG